jgi:hypothetical protein
MNKPSLKPTIYPYKLIPFIALEPQMDISQVKELEGQLTSFKNNETDIDTLINLAKHFKLLNSTLQILKITFELIDAFDNSDDGLRIKSMKNNPSACLKPKINALNASKDIFDGINNEMAVFQIELAIQLINEILENPSKQIQGCEASNAVDKILGAALIASCDPSELKLDKSFIKMSTYTNFYPSNFDGYRVSSSKAIIKSALIRIYKIYDIFGNKYQTVENEKTKKETVKALDYKTPVEELFDSIFESTKVDKKAMDDVYVYCIYKGNPIFDNTTQHKDNSFHVALKEHLAYKQNYTDSLMQKYGYSPRLEVFYRTIKTFEENYLNIKNALFIGLQ